MKVIRILVKSCEVCMNHSQYDEYPDKDIDYCTETGKLIRNVKKIPDWCPLPDASKDTDEG